MIKRGNQKSVLDNPELVNKIINKEDRYSHLIPLHEWVCKLGPHLRHNSQGVVDLPFEFVFCCSKYDLSFVIDGCLIV